MKARVQIVIESEQGQFIVEEIASINRNALSMESLGLSLAEGKNLLQTLQTIVVSQQISEWLRNERDCPTCGIPRSLKGHHSVLCRTVFGKVKVDSPRLRHCGCEVSESRSFSPLATKLTERTTPELAYLEAK